MKKLIITLCFSLSLLTSSQLIANDNFIKNSSESLDYVFSPNNSEAFLGVGLQLQDSYNSFIFNLKLNVFEGIGGAKNSTIFSLMPGLGYMLIGNENSKHKLTLKLSAGLASLSRKDNNFNGLGSETNLEYRFKNFAIDLAYLNINSNLNEYIKIGFRYYN